MLDSQTETTCTKASLVHDENLLSFYTTLVTLLLTRVTFATLTEIKYTTGRQCKKVLVNQLRHDDVHLKKYLLKKLIAECLHSP